MPIIIVIAGIAALLFLIIKLRFNAFIALILVAIGVGLAQGMPMVCSETVKTCVLKSIEKGVGGTLGQLALILGLGAMLGSLIADSGAAQNIANKLIEKFGLRYIQWSVIATGFIVGVPMFYTVGFVILIPIIFVIARSTGLPALYVGIPMAASLSVTHGFLPPHPGPTALAVMYKADIGLTLLYGLVLAIPAIIIAGPVFGRLFRDNKTATPDKLFPALNIPPERIPSFGSSILVALSPVLLMTIATFARLTMSGDSFPLRFLIFIGEPVTALLISLLVAVYALALKQGRALSSVMDGMGESVKGVAMILLIIGGGGAFKEVLVDSGISDYIVDALKDTEVSPLVLAWGIAAALRVFLGSATVAALTAGGIVAPMIEGTGVSPELLVLAIGAGSLTFSTVNDTGFWLFKEYFNLSILDTFKSWTMMETIVSLVGLAGCLTLQLIIS
ncbi:MAG TPA: gluconate:H+ symporter [Gammaproteobacteria bacterium]|nr:gluconate:H+ symporter [Gammaproteobacteria bacterium]